jgi:hypothetical protein
LRNAQPSLKGSFLPPRAKPWVTETPNPPTLNGSFISAMATQLLARLARRSFHAPVV